MQQWAYRTLFKNVDKLEKRLVEVWSGAKQSYMHVTFRVFCFPRVKQKQTLGKWKLNRHLMVSHVKNIRSKNYWNLKIFLQATINNVKNVFDVVLFISAFILSVPFSPGSAKADIGRGETWTVVRWPVVSPILYRKLLKSDNPHLSSNR